MVMGKAGCGGEGWGGGKAGDRRVREGAELDGRVPGPGVVHAKVHACTHVSPDCSTQPGTLWQEAWRRRRDQIKKWAFVGGPCARACARTHAHSSCAHTRPLCLPAQVLGDLAAEALGGPGEAVGGADAAAAVAASARPNAFRR